MEQSVNRKFEPLWHGGFRYFICMGGRGTGRSTSASQFALSKLTSDEYFRCAIMRYVLGDVRNSIYQEIKDRATETEVLNSLSVNEGLMTLKYGKNSINAVGFRKSSSEQKAKLKSLANYNAIIVEEADEVPEEDFRQLDDSLRTIKGDIAIILLLNPPAKNHWIIQEWFDLIPSGVDGFYIPVLKPSRTDTCFIGGTYLDNIANISPVSVKNYERYAETKPAHYWNMIKGYVPEVAQGLIYKDWQIIEGVPHEAKLLRYWVDFGFSGDPASVGALYSYNGGFILDELAYQIDMKNRDIVAVIKAEKEKAPVVADSSEPKSIEELREAGLIVLPAIKGPDSIRFGIKKLQAQRISVTRRSKNTIKEKDNYAWRIDKQTGEQLDDPIDRFNHSMDGARYAITSVLPDETEEHEQEEIEEEDPLYSDIGI